MEIILFVVFFSVVSLGLFLYLQMQIPRSSKYELKFIKGAVRGSMGRFTSMSSLERKRKNLCRANSKF